MAKKEKVYLVDVSGYIFRAYYAIKGNLTAQDGTPTNAVYGFTNMLSKLIADEKPAYLIPVFDVSRITFRNDLYPEYKANRSAPPEDLVPQFPLIREVVKAFNFPPVEMQGFEADDLIGTIAKDLEKKGYEICVVTSDKDMMQLVSDNIYLLDTWKVKTVREPEVMAKFGVKPEKVIEVLGMAGDTSDNVPGVPGIGEKTAIALITEFGSIEGVLENIDKVSGKKRKENLTNNADLVRLCRELVTIKTDVPIEFNLEDYKVRGFNEEKATELFKQLNFTSMLKNLEGESSSLEIDYDKYILVDDEEKLSQLVEKLKNTKTIAFDTETRTFNYLENNPLVGLSFAIKGGKAWYVPVDHTAIGTRQLDKAFTLNQLETIFSSTKKTWVMQNAKFDLHIMQSEGVTFAGRVDDTMLMSYVENPTKRAHGLDAMAFEYFGHKMIPYSEVAGKGKNQITFDQVDTKTACRYSAEDSDLTYRIYEILDEKVNSAKLFEMYDKYERKLLPSLMHMERSGFKVNRQALEDLSAKFEKMMLDSEEEIYSLAGQEFNINSPQQLSEILFDKLGLPKGKKTKTGYSTDIKVLTKLAVQHPLPEMILEYRQTAKLRSTYADALLKLIEPSTGRIHSSFNQTIAMTGRLSSSDPNLQNIPIRTEAGRLIRQAFIPDDGCVLLSADYSQVELRIMAHLSNDKILVDSFMKDEDIHRRTAAEVFDTMAAFVDTEMRRRAKAVNFGIVYGQSAYGLSESLGIPMGEAKKIIDNYFERYSGVREYMDKVQEDAHTNKEVYTMFGRRIPLTDIDSKNAATRKYSERVAINAPIQGTAADIIKLAMIDLHDEMIKRKVKSKMLLQVHDELVFEVSENELEMMKKLVVEKMESAVKLNVPLKVDVGIGMNWDEAH